MWIHFKSLNSRYIYLVCVCEGGRERGWVMWQYCLWRAEDNLDEWVELSSSGLAASILTCQVILLVQLQIITFWTFKYKLGFLI